MRSILFVVLGVAAHALAQSSSPSSPTPTVTPSATPASSQLPHSVTSSFRSALRSYYASVLNSPKFTNIAAQLFFALPASVLASVTANVDNLLPVPTSGSYDLQSLATDPPLTFATPAWARQLPASLRAQLLALETSAALRVASIDQSVLGISVPLSTPTPQASVKSAATTHKGAAARETAVAGVFGVAGVAMGAAAVLL